jgi:NADP-dependent 3-hydroxy acid dehydrogenase YdfG
VVPRHLYVRAQAMDEDSWRNVIETNLNGVSRVCRAAMPHLIDAKRGASMV